MAASLSNWHPTLQKLFAPGMYVYSSAGDSGTNCESWSGTSMATSHVAGAWALLRQSPPEDGSMQWDVGDFATGEEAVRDVAARIDRDTPATIFS